MKNPTRLLVALLAVLSSGKIKSQLSGTYAIPGTYTSIAAAINDLNSVGVNGAVVMNISAGYTETAVIGGFTLNAITGASSANTIAFQKSGTGANPLIYAYTGTATPSSAVQDGVWRFNGSDYITIDGIDISDPNTTNPGTMEFGYGFFKASVSDGCQNNTIKNCVITLNRVNNASGTAPATDGSRGIEVVNATIAAQTTALTITAAAGANSNNKFYSNTIQNCNIGFSIIGFADASPYAFADLGNDVGGNSGTTGNTIINFGGGAATNAAAGIRTLAQYNLNVAYNTVNNNNGSGVSHAGDLRGIYINTAAGANAAITNNTVTLKCLATSALLTAIQNASGSSGTSNTVTISGNLVTNCSYTTSTGGTFGGIINSGTPSIINISNNMLSSNTFSGSSTTFTGIDGGGTSGIMVNLITNTVTGNSHLGAYGTFYCMRAGTASVTLNGNTINTNNFSSTSGSSSSSLYGYYNISSPTYEVYTNNIIDNLTISGASTANAHTIYGLYSNTASSSLKTISGNRISSLSIANGLPGGTIYGIYHALTGTTTISKNKLYDYSAGGAAGLSYGIYISSGGIVSIYNNLIGDLKAPASNLGLGVAGIYINGGTTSNIYYNTVYLNAASTGTLFGSTALYVSTSPNVTLRNNILVNLSTFTGTGLSTSYRRSSTTLTSYAAVSNNNLFYAGAPGAGNLIFYDGTTGYQTLASFKTFLATRDGLSVTENPTFVSTTGSNTNFLNINTVTPTQIESGASPISGITDDFSSLVRNTSSPDIGAWEGSYVINDIIAPAMNTSGFTTSPCVLSGRTFTASFADASGVASGSLAPKIYYKLNSGAYSSSSGTLTSGTVNNGVWTFNLIYSATLADVVSYFVVAQDAFSTPNIIAFPPAGFSGTDVNTLSTNPTTPNTYIVNTLNGVYTVGSGGNFTSLTAAANAYNTFCITGPVTFSLTDALYSTAETFPITFKNTVYASASNSLLILPASGVSVVLTPTAASLSSIIKFQDAHYITIDGINNGGSSFNINNSTASAATANIWLASTNTAGSGNSFITVKNTRVNGASNSTSNGLYASVDGALPTSTGGSDNDNITITSNTLLVVSSGILSYATSTTSSGGSDNWVITNNLIGPATAASTANVQGNGVYMSNALNISIASNTIQNVSTSSSGGISINNSSNFSINSNSMLNFTTSSTAGGIYVNTASNFSITANTCQNFKSSSSGGLIYVTAGSNFVVSSNAVSNMSTSVSSYHGININSNCTTFSVVQNTLNNFVSGSTTTGNTSAMAGIYLGSSVVNGTIGLNLISGITNTATGGYGARGMMLNTTGTSSIVIRNNFISDIFSYSDAGGAYWPIGIGFEGSTGGVNVLNNSVNLFGTHSGLSGATGSAAMYLNGGGNNALINNIFCNTYDNLTSTSEISYAIYSAIGAANTPTMDYNNYYVGGAAASQVLGYVGSARTTLFALQSGFVFGQNIHSLNFQPQFTSNNDLHLITSAVSNAGINNAALALSNVLIDIDGQTRSTTTPDIGADEFTATGTCTSAVGGTLAVTAATLCTTGTILATPSGVSSGLGTSYQWKAGLTTGGPYVSVSTGTGTSSPTLFSPLSTYTPGVYFVVFESTCASPALTGVSNEATITIIAGPTVGIASTSSLLCQGTSATLSATGNATAFAWSTGGTNSSITITPTATTPYTLTGTSGICSAVSTINILYSALPIVNVVSTSPTVCSNVSATLTASGAATYSWNTGSTSAVINPTQTTNTSYTVTGYNVDGCKSVPVFTTVSVNAAPVINLSGSSGICTGQTATINATGALTYTWSTGSNANSITDAPSTNTVYSVSGTNASGCISSSTQSVSVAAFLLIGISGPTAVCQGQPANLSASGGVTYLWDDGSSTNTIAPIPTGNTTYSVVGASGTCSNSVVFSVVVNSNPTVSASGNTLVCSGQVTTFTANGANTYTWSNGANSSTANVTPVSNSIYTVTGTSAIGCNGSATFAVNTNSAPVISIVSTATGVCMNSTATLTASGAGSYTWAVSGSPSTTLLTISPTANTIYTVNGTNAANCVSSKTISIASYSLPVVTISPASSTVCALTMVSLSASGGTAYVWSAAGGSNTSASYTPAASTVYSVTGYNSLGCAATGTTAVTTNSLPVISISPASTTLCSLSPATFTAFGANSYVWNGSAIGSTFTSISAASTVYSVTGYNSNNCGATQTVAATALPLPVIAVTPSFVTVCAMSTGIYTVSGALTYVWENNSTATTVAITPTSSAGSFSVTGTDANGCMGHSSAVILTTPAPVITVSPASVSICPNTAQSFTAQGALSYTWSNGPTMAVAVITPSASGIYTVSGSNTVGCAGTATVNITTKPAAVIVISPASSSVCLNSQASFTASGAASYTWNTGSTLSDISVAALTNTVYTISGKNGTGCAGTATVGLHVWQLSVLNLSASAMTLCAKETVTLNATGATNYTWYPFNVTGSVITNAASNTTQYNILGVDANGCSNTASITIVADKCTGIAKNSSLDNAVHMYPNPSSGLVNAEFDFDGKKEIMIMNSTGAVIELISTENRSETFNLSDKAKGVYFIKVTTTAASVNYKVIIQ